MTLQVKFKMFNDLSCPALSLTITTLNGNYVNKLALIVAVTLQSKNRFR